MTAPGHLEMVDDTDEILGDNADEFLGRLGQAALIRRRGRDRSRARAVVTLLHGNEPSGLRAVWSWLRLNVVPAVDCLIFLPGVEAALTPPRFTHRVRPGGRDLNRCFAPPFDGTDGELASEILAQIGGAECEAVIDLHNNTGHNPVYGVGPVADDQCLGLVALFANRFVLTDLHLGALMEAVAAERPAVTIECGRAGDPAADAVAFAGLQRFLHADRLEPLKESDGVEIFASPVRVRLRPGTRLVFSSQPADDADLTLTRDIDRHNFEILAAGHHIGWIHAGSPWPLEARDAEGNDISHTMFAVNDGALHIRHEMIPIMMTTQPEIALQDCLFYAVERRPR
jgi:hypothetical protein